MIQHSFGDGKYVVTLHDDGKMEATRHGEPWHDLSGNKMVYCMLQEVDDLTTALAQERAAYEDMQTRYGTLQMNHEFLQEGRSRQAQEVADLTRHLEIAGQDLANLRQRRDSLRNHNDELLTLNDSLRVTNTNLTTALELRKATIEILEQTAARNEAAVKDLQSTVAEIRSTLHSGASSCP